MAMIESPPPPSYDSAMSSSNNSSPHLIIDSTLSGSKDSSPPSPIESADLGVKNSLSSKLQCLLQGKLDNVQESYDRWKPLAVALEPKYEEIARVLCEQATGLNIAAVTGSSVGAAAGVTVLATMGMLFAPATFGISAATGAALAATTATTVGIGAAAAVISNVALAADVILEKNNIDSIADLEDKVTEAEKVMCIALKELLDICQTAKELQVSPDASTNGSDPYSILVQAIAHDTTRAVSKVDVALATVIMTGRAVMNTAGRAAVKVAGGLVGGVGVILDVRQISKSLEILSKRQEDRSIVAQQLRENAKQLKLIDDQVHDTIAKATELMAVISSGSKSLELASQDGGQFGALEEEPKQ